MILAGKENDILLRLQSGKENYIFGFMFGDPILTVHNPDESIAFTSPAEIIQMPLADIDIVSDKGVLVYEWGWPGPIVSDKGVLVYEWGWPGPDVTVYKISDYGRTWAFTKEELEVRA